MSELTGKRVVITGGTRGIGRVTALELACRGARLLVCHRDPDSGEALTKELADVGQGHTVVRADVTDQDQVESLALRAAEQFGEVDAVVNNAGVDGHVGLDELDPAEWRRVLDVNLTAQYRVVSAMLPLLADPASVVNLGASVALRGRPQSAHYTASKAAVHGLTRSMAKELGPRGVRVNLVAPGVIDKGDGDVPPPVVAAVSAMTALGRLGACDEVADVVAFLVSDRSTYISGSTVNVDGGM